MFSKRKLFLNPNKQHIYVQCQNVDQSMFKNMHNYEMMGLSIVNHRCKATRVSKNATYNSKWTGFEWESISCMDKTFIQKLM